ncbi:MAG: Predicted L-rhamnose ABC transporter, transmembrane component 2 [uncultured Thermomicrobiales bacterium]|uniref:Autoinducer 2 import system permease protein LsrC n=1 Tax=uncultured Thermomicrobiales bacterium TaxID=1645740 RepID=A0A6J4TX36_9BACT|nr:MAG: Predicted L-rhamnose ABC transporter, transmembrane component 2 [uncultured Thermomicrobiales bacterium]
MASRSAPGRADRLVTLVGRVRELGLLIALLVLVVAVGLRAGDRFLSLGNLRTVLLAVSILAVMAAGQTLVVLTRNVDLSVASIVGLTTFVAGDLFKQNPGIAVPLVVGLACLLGLALGAINGALVTVGRVPAIVATLGTLYVYRGTTFWIAGGEQVNVSDVPDGYRDIAMTRAVADVPNPILIAGAIALVVAYVLRYTRIGRQLYAIGSNPDAARLAGIRSDRLVFGAFAACGLLCGLAGVLWGARYGRIDSRAATGYELQVVAAVVVGGVNIFGGAGTVLGAVLGAVLLGTVANALTILRFDAFWLQAISGLAILIAVTIDLLITRRVGRTLLAGRNR